MADNDKMHELHFVVGELTAHIKSTQESINRQTCSIDRLSTEVNQLSSKHSKLEQGLAKANEDIILIKNNMITEEKLNSYGLSSDDKRNHREDMTYLRNARHAFNKRKPIIFNIKRGVITAIASLVVTAIWAIAKNHIHWG